MNEVYFKKVPFSLELALAKVVLDKWIDKTYAICSGHREHNSSSSNEYPCIRMDPRDLLWKMESPEDHDCELEDRVLQNFYDDLEEDMREWFEYEKGFKITTDINGYRMLAIVPLIDKMYERLEKEDEIIRIEEQIRAEEDEDYRGYPVHAMYKDIEELVKEIEEIDDELQGYASKLEEFEKYVEGLKSYYEDYFWVFNNEEKYRFVPEWEYEYFLKEDGWFKWSKEADEKAEEFVKEE